MRRSSVYLVLATCCVWTLAGCTSTPTSGTASNAQPSKLEQFNDSVAAVPRAIGNSIVSGATTVGHWVVPQPHPAIAASTAAASSSDATSSNVPKVGPELYVASARLYERGGNFIGAADQYRRALKVAPDNLVALLSYAHLMDRQNKLDQATELYQRAVKAHPHEAAPYNDLGLCYARRRMLNESVASLSQAVKLQPDRELYRNNLATVLVEQNRPDEALKQLQAVQANAVAHYNVAYLLQQRGHEQVALEYVNRAVQLDPSFNEARDLSMRLAARTGTPPTGQPVARMAALPANNGYLSGNRYFGQQTSGVYQPMTAAGAQTTASDYPSNELRILPPVQ